MWKNDKELFNVARNELSPALVGDVLDTMEYYHQFLSPQCKPVVKNMVVIGIAMPVLEADVFADVIQGKKNELMSVPLPFYKKNQIL